MKRVGTSMMVAGALLAGGCSNLEQPNNPDAIRNDIAAGNVLGKTSNALLGRIGLNTTNNEPLLASRTPVKAPLDDREMWATFHNTIASPDGTGTCDITVTARNNRDGSLGGWTFNGATNQPAVTEFSLSGQGQKIDIVSPATPVSFESGPEASLTVNNDEYVVSPESNQQQLTGEAISQATQLANTVLDLCGIQK